ncbi:MAG: DUF4215 domain-containing protein [Myxococcales bacterium]|nr:DUF4215 domain-containing protein [Myxococcales bacterium]
MHGNAARRLRRLIPLALATASLGIACTEGAGGDGLVTQQLDLSTAVVDGWAGINLGLSEAAFGSSSSDGTTFHVRGGGPDFWGPDDHGHFVYREVDGDFELTATIAAWGGDTSQLFAKAILLFKPIQPGETEPTSDGPAIIQAVNYSADDFFYARRATGGVISDLIPAIANDPAGPATVRMTRTGGTFHASILRGSTWEDWGSITTGFPTHGFVGIASTSITMTPLDVTFTDLTLTGPGTTVDTTPPTVLETEVFASDTYATFRIVTDEPTAAVLSLGPTTAYGTDSSSATLQTEHYVRVDGLTTETPYHYRIRVTDRAGNRTDRPDATLTTTPPDTVGPVISAFETAAVSYHGATLRFRTDEPATVSVRYDINAYEHTIEGPADARTRHEIVLNELLSGAPHQVEITATDARGHSTVDTIRNFNTTAYTNSGLPPGWSSQDIGPVSAERPGSARYDATVDTWAVKGTGTDVFFAEDSFHFVHRPVNGDFRLTVRVTSYSGYLQQWTKALTMFRADFTPGSRMFNQSINYEGLDYLYYRPVANEWHTEITATQWQDSIGEPIWARLERRGNVFTESYSHDGRTWTVHGPAGGTEVALPRAGHAGIGICGKRNEWLSEITYSNVVLEDCGDGYVAGEETCDDGNETAGDGCSATCRTEVTWTCDRVVGRVPESSCSHSRCGDSVVDDGEECDDGNHTDLDGCNAFCRREGCGDGTLQPGEACDDGNELPNDGCSPTCRIEVCGDGIIQTGEACDDGNTRSDDGCDSRCRAEVCGDAIRQMGIGEECDDGNTIDFDGCSGVCHVERCGDGIEQPGEGCDDGNVVPNDGCDALCVVERCGDHIVQTSEQCDDGNTDDADGCSATCRWEFCGDGVTQPNEECDDGDGNSETEPNACRPGCTLPRCGDFVVDDGEECDRGVGNDDTLPDWCRTDCRDAHCGDGVLDAGEECDDGNTDNGDRCSNACATEDPDGDGLRDSIDNCPDAANPEQEDLDGDHIGDACDDDIDGDTIPNSIEDANGDGVVDDDETDPRNADTDGDDLCDGNPEFPLFDTAGTYLCSPGEDLNANGVVDEGETDPRLIDTDGDCSGDGFERMSEPPTDPTDPLSVGLIFDRDGDGIGDVCDACPDVFAPAGDDDGCPPGVEPGSDAGADAGGSDAGDGDAGGSDAGGSDAGGSDAGGSDAGGDSSEGAEDSDDGGKGKGLFGCSAAPTPRPAAIWLVGVGLVVAFRRRRTHAATGAPAASRASR